MAELPGMMDGNIVKIYGEVKTMRITGDMINSEIRLSGRFKGFFISILFSCETILRATRKLQKKVLSGKTSSKISCEKIFIEKRNGEKLRTCIYKPLRPKENATGLLWIHGGGYAIGAPEMDTGYAEEFILTTDCVIVSPDYTLSTEKPYPAAVEDCYEALVWMKENASKLGIRDDQLFVGGVSAGGGLTVAVTLMARDKGEVNIAFQMPLYPMIDDMMTNASAIDNNAPIWNSRFNMLAWRMYLGDLFCSENVPKYAAPARETDYSRLPSAYTFVGDIEPFYDETIAFFDKLQKTGVSAKVDVYKGCYHAFDIMCPGAEISKRATGKMLDEFRFAADNYFAGQGRE